MRYAPQNRIVQREIADAVASAAQGFEGALAVRVEEKRQGPPKLHDLPSLQKLCGSRFGWSAGKTLEVAQQLYDGQGKKIITYPRAEVRYLPQCLISDVPKIVAGLRVGQSFSATPVPDPPVIRKGASGSFYDKGLEGASHHAVIPNVKPIQPIPRSAFLEKAGIAPLTEILTKTRTIQSTERLTLISPVLLPNDRVWRFRSPIGEFGYFLKDEKFLNAALNGTLRLGLKKGIQITAQIETKEEFEGGVWVQKRREIIKVVRVHR
jgi:hypothetical protein